MRIPWERLPPGFAETVTRIPEHPVEPRPAATIVLMRESGGGGSGDRRPAGDGMAGSADLAGGRDRAPEVLLLRRVRSSGFVPGAWVFPGGRVDRADADPGLLRRVVPADAPTRLAERLGVGAAEGGPAAALGYLNAALREAFEETGIPVGWAAAGDAAPAGATDGVEADRPDSGGPGTSIGPDPEAVARIRARLLNDQLDWLSTLEELDLRIDAAGIAYLAHWVTPVQEPRRYDARFFLAEVPAGTDFELDPREMSAGRWVTVEEALELHDAGDLPMVFPTIRTLESLRGFETVSAAIDHFGAQAIPRILPRLVAEEEGVRMVVETP